jgi:hypothetical protein
MKKTVVGDGGHHEVYLARTLVYLARTTTEGTTAAK